MEEAKKKKIHMSDCDLESAISSFQIAEVIGTAFFMIIGQLLAIYTLAFQKIYATDGSNVLSFSDY